MNNEKLLEFMFNIAEAGASAGKGQDLGEVVAKGRYGDRKHDIDQIAEDAITNRFKSEIRDYGFKAALKPEDADWGEEWLKANELVNDLEDLDYAFLVDQVEGTKNYDNRDRYTTIAAVDPEDPNLEGVRASLVYRWDDTVFFSDGENSYHVSVENGDARKSMSEAEILEAGRLDEVGYDSKIRGQAIGLNVQDYADLMEELVDRYDLEEVEWPSLKADGTTTGDILGTVTDNSIAVDIRALRGRERLPFAQDFAPAAKIARDAGAEIFNEKGDPVRTNFTEPGAATAYVALPPGKIAEEIKEELPELLMNL